MSTNSRTAARELVLSVDVGSTAVKVVAMTREGQIAASASRHYVSDSRRPGWVEQHPQQWWEGACAAIRECVANIGAAGGVLLGVSFSGHMSAPVLLGNDGHPVMPSIMIADARSSEETAWLRQEYGETFVAMTGNMPIDAFTVSKLLWIKNNVPDALRRAATLLFPKDFIRYRLSGHLLTDPTDAGNSLLYDAVSGRWSAELIRELGLPERLFPELQPSHGEAGRVSPEAAAATGLPEGLPVFTGAADMACSQLGTGASEDGILAVTLSTSGQAVMRVKGIVSEAVGKLTFHPSAIPGTLYAMGSIFTGGLGVDWAYRMLSDKTQLQAEDYEAIGILSRRMDGIPPGSDGLLFLPFLVGSGTPHFDAVDRASWLGLATGQPKELLLHSVMEGVAYNIREAMELFEASGYPAKRLHLGGGGSKNEVWSRMIGDVLDRPLARLHHRDASAVGASLLAGLGCGWYTSVDEAARIVVSASEPTQPNEERAQAYGRIYGHYREVYHSLNRYYRATAAENGLSEKL